MSIPQEIYDELDRAMNKFPMWPSDPLHAIGVVNEEVGELSKAVLQQMYEPHKQQPGDVRKEAIQAAAMLLRFIAGLDNYQWVKSCQFRQRPLGSHEDEGVVLGTNRTTSGAIGQP